MNINISWASITQKNINAVITSKLKATCSSKVSWINRISNWSYISMFLIMWYNQFQKQTNKYGLCIITTFSYTPPPPHDVHASLYYYSTFVGCRRAHAPRLPLHAPSIVTCIHVHRLCICPGYLSLHVNHIITSCWWRQTHFQALQISIKNPM